MIELEIAPCSAGEHGNSDDACVACEIGKYNHGDSRDCYAIENNIGIVYKDRFGVKCATGWVGSPFYEDGKYEGGCEDGDVAVDIINFRQIRKNGRCSGSPYITWYNDIYDDISADNCAEWCTEDESCCENGIRCKACCLSFTLNKSLCQGFRGIITDTIEAEKFRCFTWDFRKPSKFFPTNIYKHLPHICQIYFLGKNPTNFPTAFPSRIPTGFPVSPKPTAFPSAPLVCLPPPICPNIGLWGVIVVTSVMGIYGFYYMIVRPINRFLRSRSSVNDSGIALSEMPTAPLSENDSMRVVTED